MSMNSFQTICAILIIVPMQIAIFVAGIYIGKFLCINNIQDHSLQKTNTIKTLQQKTISIDDTKFVTKINTDGLEKKFNKDISESQETETDISSSINKLKSMKG